MANQYKNKIVYNGTILLDLSGDTVTLPEHIMAGFVGHLSDGRQVTGTGQGSGTVTISVVDTEDSHGGTIRTITALDISDTTAVAADVAQGKYFYTADGTKTAGTASGGGSTPSATAHTIYFEFSDSTNTTITAYWDSSFISDAITATTPTIYGGKTVALAQLDGVTWYTRPTETWETLIDDNVAWIQDSENDYPYCWISSLNNVTIPNDSVWRITYDNVEYRLTAVSGKIGNPKWGKGTDDGTNVPFVFENAGWGAWTGSLNVPNVDSSYYFKIERLVTS